MNDFLPPPPALDNGAALLLDFDGTLVDIADTPDGISVPGSLGALLGRLATRLEGRVALVSGRALADLDRHVASPDIVLSGSHGVELRTAGAAPAGVGTATGLSADLRAAVLRFARAERGLLVEEKPAGVALHYRGAPEAQGRVAAFAAEVAEREGLRVQHGKMVAELLPAHADKGEAVRRIMAEPPFEGARPWFVGDDLTDEAGFAAAAALGGEGVLVGEPRPTAARWGLADVAAVHDWLEQAAS